MIPVEEQGVPQTTPSEEHRRISVKSLVALGVFIICTVLEALSLFFPSISVNLVGNLLTYVQTIFAILACVGLGTLPLVQKIIRQWFRLLLVKMKRKSNVLLNYVDSDRQWERWLKEVLEEREYRVISLEWRQDRIFQKEFYKTQKKVKMTFSIVSPEMLKLAAADEQWFHVWKSRNNAQGRSKLICVREEIYKQFPSDGLDLGNLSGKQSAEAAEEELEKWLFLWSGSSSLKKTQKTQDKRKWRYPGRQMSDWIKPSGGHNIYFIGRDLEMQKVLDAFFAKHLSVVLHGLKGIGKTEIAKEYTYRHQDKYTRVLWLGMEEAGRYDNDLREIVKNLAIEAKSNKIDELEQDLCEWLTDNDDWLLILDGCQEAQKAEKFHKVSIHGKLLITTSIRVKDFIGKFEHITIDEMSKEDAKRFLDSGMKRAQQEKLSMERAETIIGRLGAMPEALEAICTYVINKQGSPEQYLYERQQRLQQWSTMNNGVQKKAEYSWWPYFEKIQQGPAAEIMKYCALLNPSVIPLEIIRNIAQLNLSDLQLGDAIHELCKIFLMECDEQNILIVKPHIHNYFRDWLPERIKQNVVVRVIQAVSKTLLIPSVTNLHRSWDYAIQASSCEELIRIYRISGIALADFYDAYGHYLTEHAEYKDAHNFLQKGLVIREQLQKGGQDQRLALATNGSYRALLLSAQGERGANDQIYQDIAQLWQEISSILEVTTGGNSPELATALYWQAQLCYIWRNLTLPEAMDPKFVEFQQICQRLESIWQNNSPLSLNLLPPPIVTLSLLKEQGSIYFMQGNYTRSIEKYAEALQFVKDTGVRSDIPVLQQEIFTVEIALCEARISRSRFKQGTVEKAGLKEQYRQSLKTYRKHFGEFHPETAQMHINLGDLHKEMQDGDAAKISYRHALRIYTIIAPTHETIKYLKQKIADLDG